MRVSLSVRVRVGVRIRIRFKPAVEKPTDDPARMGIHQDKRRIISMGVDGILKGG